MEELWAVLKEAHAEVLNATGWGLLLDGLAASWNGDGDGMISYFYQNIFDFVNAVNWSEPFFMYLAAFHVVVIIAVVALTWRASTERLIAVDVILLLLGWSSSYLNDLGRSHAVNLFVEKGVNYFDKGGLFISIVYWCPLFLMALLLQGRVLLRMLKLMVSLKRRQLQEEMRRRRGRNPASPAADEAKKEK